MYELRRENLWKYAGDNVLNVDIAGNEQNTTSDASKYKSKHLSYFVPRKPSDARIGGEKHIPETFFDRKVYLSWAVEQFTSHFMLKSKKKFADKEFKKKYHDIAPYQVYALSSLQNYLQQAIDEGTKYVLVSWQEYKMLEGGKV